MCTHFKIWASCREMTQINQRGALRSAPFCKPKAFISPLGVKFLRFIPTADKFDPIKVKAEAAAYPKTHLFVDSGYHLEGMWYHFLGISLYPTSQYILLYSHRTRRDAGASGAGGQLVPNFGAGGGVAPRLFALGKQRHWRRLAI